MKKSKFFPFLKHLWGNKMNQKIYLTVILCLFFAISCVERKVYIPTGKEEITGVETAKMEQKPSPDKEKPTQEEIKTPSISQMEELIRKLQSEIGDIYFDFDKYDIRQDAIPNLKKVASILQKYPKLRVVIEGHCDERGTNEYNFALGQRRANSAKQYLVTLGIASSRIDIVSYGEEKPLCTEQNEACWQKNRRAHFVFIEEGK